MTGVLVSPVTSAALVADGPDCLRDIGGRRWPVLDGIPYLRAGRDDLVREALARLDGGDRDGALVLLLADQDDWWSGEKPKAADLRWLIAERDRLSLRKAMNLLSFGRVGDYFAHRWSDPTFLAGLGLLEAHWRPADSAFELACGIGHYGRELARRGIAYTGADVVFAKLWLARHWILPPAARLLCFDAAAPWPVADRHFDLVFCNDAFYFLEPKREILARLRALARSGGRLALGHVHNSGAENFSSGRAVSVAAMASFFPDAVAYDDAELTRAVAEGRAARVASWDTLGTAEAFAVEDGRACAEVSRLLGQGLGAPVSNATMRLNPLYAPAGNGYAIAWPSSRYEAEYARDATFPMQLDAERRDSDAVRRRIVVDLPERW